MEVTATIFPTERQRLYDRLKDKLEVAFNLSRKVVSFQANKDEPFYRWFKYKEGFSSSIVKYFLEEYCPKDGKVLDPFAGAGTTLFAANEAGCNGYGIELLPVGIFAMQTRQAVNKVDVSGLRKTVKKIWDEVPLIENITTSIRHIPITKDAFSDETEKHLNQYLTYCETIQNFEIKTILRFAAFAVVEEISFTRKDGQYLRWDYRSKRNLSGKPFDKGKIKTFKEAVSEKLHHIVCDLSPSQSANLFSGFTSTKQSNSTTNLIEGSCLEQLPKLENNFFDFVITSPPYCNRYDYTRTYALELVFLGNDNEQVRRLRQEMLSCTVENKEKVEHLCQFYQQIGKPSTFDKVMEVYNSSPAMLEVNTILNELNKQEKLNNSNIARMVKNYFLEMCFVIYELARVTKSKGHCIIVNDNVRYGGEEIPVDLILSEFAEYFDFEIKKILVLPKGKGNSSQQMGSYGRAEVRKCVYVWQKR
jgi:DNA modification methylase